LVKKTHTELSDTIFFYSSALLGYHICNSPDVWENSNLYPGL